MAEMGIPQRSVDQYRFLGTAAVIAGLLLLAENLAYISGVSRFWPLVVTMLGGGFVRLYSTRRRESAILGIGVYLLCFSILALVLNFAGWDHLARLWPLFIAFLGVSFLAARAAGHGGRISVFCGVLMLGLAAVFFLVLQVSARLWPTSLLFFGASIWAATKGKQATDG